MERRSADRTSEAAQQRLAMLARELGRVDAPRPVAEAAETAETAEAAGRWDDEADLGDDWDEMPADELSADERGAGGVGADARRTTGPDVDAEAFAARAPWPAGLRPRETLPAGAAPAGAAPGPKERGGLPSFEAWVGRHRSGTTRSWDDSHTEAVPARLASALGHGVSRPHVRVVTMAVVVVAVLVGWWLMQAQPETVVAEPLSTGTEAAGTEAAGSEAAGSEAAGSPSTGAEPAGADAAAGAPASSQPDAAGGGAGGTATEVVVDVAGRVRRPGIVSLRVGARVADAIKAAGGAKKGTDLTPINLARLVVDGEQIVVGLPAVPGTSAPGGADPGGTAGSGGADGGTGAGGTLVNLNTATLDELDTLPQVGPVTAQAILDWRTEHGRFSTVDELLEVSGIGEATLAKLRELVTV